MFTVLLTIYILYSLASYICLIMEVSFNDYHPKDKREARMDLLPGAYFNKHLQKTIRKQMASYNKLPERKGNDD